MSKITGSEVPSLLEAYSAVYNSDLRENFEENQLASEIFETVSYTLISQGYTSIDVLEYFVNVDDEVIIEDLISLSEGTFIFEEIVSEEYIEEQIQQLDEFLGAAVRVASAAAKAAKYAPQAAKIGQRALSALGGAGKAAQRISQQGVRQSAVVRPALGRAVQAVKSAGAGVKSKVSGAVGKAKDIARSALSKIPGGSQGKLSKAAKFTGKAALGGAAFEGGMRGVSSLFDKGGAAKTAPSGKYNAPAALGGQTAFKAGGGTAAMKSGATAADIQKKGTEALRQREKTPDTAAGFDTAFSSARKLGQKEFKWRGGKYTTQLAHTDLFDIVKGHLLDEGYADTEQAAEVIMVNMSEEWKQSILDNN